MMKNKLKKSAPLFIASIIALAGLLFIASCTIGLGDAIDVDAPTVEVSYPPKNAIVRDSFVAAGKCDDDLALDYVDVTATNTSSKKVYGPYRATLSKDSKSWTVELNKKAEGNFDAFNAYTQWEFPDGNYIISAVSHDKDGKASQAASLPVSIDNTAPVLLVSKPLATGTENASIYGRNLNIVGDISEEHETTKLTLNYKEFNVGTNSFIDSTVRSLEISGFGTMSSDNPLTIAKFDETTAENAASILTSNYRSIYGQDVDVSQSNQKNYYCGFLLEDNARIYRTPGDSGVEPGNQTTQYYILSDDYNEYLFSEETYSLNARNLMLLLNGQSSYNDLQISSITNILKETGNSASSTELESDKSSKFSIDPKNNPVWSITNFDLHDGTFIDYDMGSAIPLVLKAGGDGKEINKNSIAIELYHLGYSETPAEITESTPHLTLISPGEYREGLLKERVNPTEGETALEFSSTDVGLKINHFYEFRVTGSDVDGISIESENGLRYGFKRNSTYTDPRFTFDSTGSTSRKENEMYSGTDINTNGITIKGTVTTGHNDIELDNITISGITITDTLDSNQTITASDTNTAAEVKYSYTATIDRPPVDNGDPLTGRGKTYNFTVEITPKENDANAKLYPVSAQSAYKYKIGLVAEDSYHAKNQPEEFEFTVDNKAPEIPADDIVVTPLVTQTNANGNSTNYVNGIVIISGTASDVGGGLSTLSWKIDNGEEHTVSGAGATWKFALDTTSLTDGPYTLHLIARDSKGNESLPTDYPLHVLQSTDNPVIDFTSITDDGPNFFTSSNRVIIGSITDDDGLASVSVNGAAQTVSTGSTSANLNYTLPSTEGEYEISVTATDQPTKLLNGTLPAGTEAKTRTRGPITVIVDNGAPEIIIDTPNSNANTYYQNAPEVKGKVKDGSGFVTLKREVYKIENNESLIGEADITIGNAAQIIAGTAEWNDNTISLTESGTYKILYTAKDKYAAYDGHTSTQFVTFSIDKNAPSITKIKLDDKEISLVDNSVWYNKNSGNFTIETSDGTSGSGVVSVAYTTTDPEGANPVWVNMSGSGNTWNSYIAFGEDASSVKHLWIKATDKAGNVSAAEHVQLQMDVTKPGLTVTGLSGNIYVNKSGDLTLSGTITDTQSGIPAVTTETKPLKYKIVDTDSETENATASWVDFKTLTITGSAFEATIDKEQLKSGALTVCGTDLAGNSKEISPCTLIVDTTAPEIKDLTLTMSNSKPVYKKAAADEDSPDTYFINRGSAKTDTLIISGTVTDDYVFDRIILKIGESEKTPVTSSTWSFSGNNLKDYSSPTRVTLTAYDKAGNTTILTFDLKFDETKPARKVTKVGTGNQNDARYGKLTSADIYTEWKSEETGSGIAKIEYKLYGADLDLSEDLTAAQMENKNEIVKALKSKFNTLTRWTASGTLSVSEADANGIYKAAASISGFKQTKTAVTGTNYLLLRPTDNCGNIGDVSVHLINVDQSAPEIIAASTEKLTNGTTPITLSGSVKDVYSGLKALRVYVNGTLAINGDCTKNPPNSLTVVAKKADGTTLSGKNGNTSNDAVEVSFTNDYGTLTYKSYAPTETELAAENFVPGETTTKQSFKKNATYATWELKLTPNKGSWFSSLSGHPVVAISAEDWADEWKDYKETGNVAPNPTKVAVLKKDTVPPTVDSISPANNAVINGTNIITGTSSDEGSVPEEVSLYYATSEAEPDSLSDYTLLKTLTTKASPASPAVNTEYGVNISQLYNYSFTENFFAADFIAADADTSSVWILVLVKDAAGNESVINPVKYTIDRNKDRPTITFTDINLENTSILNPVVLSSSDDLNGYRIYVSVFDDDGAVNSVAFRLNPADNWTSITGGSFVLTQQGSQNIEFKVVDSTNAVFTTTEEDSWKRLYITDSTSPAHTFEAPIPVTIDTKAPVVTLTEIRTTTKENLSTIAEADWSEWVSKDSFNKVFGGSIKNIQLKFTATDDGTGVDAATVKASVKLGDNEISGSPFTALPLAGAANTYTVSIPCYTGSGTVNVKLIAQDEADHEGKVEKSFEQDNTKPEINVNTPRTDKEQSGSITATGSVSENVKFSYAVSPIEASPDGYTALPAFSYLKKSSDTGSTSSVNLASAGASSELASLCAYRAYSDPADTRIATFSIDLVLNSWLIDMGITTSEALADTVNPFDDIVKLYLHLKAEDPAGNIKEIAHPIWVDPQGDRPKVYFSYPATDNPTLGGSINIIGSVEGKTSSYDVYMQIDADGDGDWDNDDKAMLESAAYGYTLSAIPNLSAAYGIKIHIDGSVWRQKINERGEFDPTVEGQKRTINLRLYAVDAENRISSVRTKTINIDNDVPVVNQNVQLVQWKTGFNAANGLDLTADGSAQLGSDGYVKFAAGAVKAKRSYTEGMSVPGKWYVVGYVSDFSGISEVRTSGSSGSLLSASLDTNEAIILPYKVTNGEDEITNYVFSFPVGSTDLEAVGTSETTLYAKDNGTGEKAKSVTKVFKVNYDNKAPVVPAVVDIQNGLKIMNNNGYYSFGSEAYEETINGANQSGIDRIAFYFTRELNGQNKALNPVIRLNKTGSLMNVSDFTAGPEGLLWQSLAVSGVNEADITVAALPASPEGLALPAYAHKGGLVKVNETIYKIRNISGNVVTLSGTPGNATEAFFTFAGVVDSEAPEDIPADAEKILEDYGYGYPVSSHDDGDLIPESCLKSGVKCTWEASINSKNMSDGPVTIHYVVFDKAGNYYSHEASGIVQNNSPRLAGAYIGTDENGNGGVEDSEFVSYHQLYTGGYNGMKKITELTLPLGASASEPASAIKIKRKTVIKPEIVGGNGVVGYTYTVSKRNASGSDWAAEYYYSGNVPKDLGTGTGDSDELVTLGSGEYPEGIVLTVDDLLRNGIKDEEYQKFAFTIWDHTPGLNYGTDSQSAVLNIIMDVALNDTTPATNKIIPFYWNSAKENSLKLNNSNYGHIELSKDLPSEITVKTPKVSGAFKLEGIAQDNSLLKNLYVKFKGTERLIASYADGVWTSYSGTGSDAGWSAEIRQATYAELKAAGYITTNPAGKRDKDNVPYASQAHGHIVHWTMNIDTELMGITPEEGIEITVSALDKGTPYTATGAVNRNEAGDLVYTAKAFANNGDGASPAQSGGDDGEQTYTSRYTLDVVPYITTIKTKLSENSKKNDSTEFDRTALGHYPVKTGETIIMRGFNLTGGTVKFVSENNAAAEVAYNAGGFVLPSNAKSGKVSIIVNGVESYNNKNNNNSQGSYGAAMPAVSAYGDKKTYNTFTNFYNRRPNTANNYLLTDNVEFDVWTFNDKAAKPYASGLIFDPIMKVNPSNGIIGFAYQSGERRFSMANGNSNSYQGYIGDYDNLSATGFAYDSEGNTYGVALGGDINGANSVAKFAFMTSLWGSSGMSDSSNKEGAKHQRFEQIGQIGTKADRTPDGAPSNNQTDYPGQYIDKSRALSPSIAVSGSGINSTVYLAYYDNFNQEIRFRWAARPVKPGSANNGTRGFAGVAGASNGVGKYIDDNFGNKILGANSKLQDGNGKYWSTDKYNIIDFQIIAEEKSYTYAETTNGSGNKDDNYKSVGVEQTSPSLGVSGPYVDIAVLPANSSGNENNYDVVVMVWYDSKNNKLKYTYNTVDLASVSRADFEGSAHTKDHWQTATTIFSHAGYYCNIEVDGEGGVHIAAYDNDAGDIYYAKLPAFGTTYNESTMSCVVDSNGMVGSNLTLDVAYDKAASEGGKAIPYISYYGSIGPKMAFLTAEGATQTSVAPGAVKDKYTGFWEITEIPTTSNVPKDRVNVAVWKDGNGVIKASTSAKTANEPAGASTTATNAITKGNGSTNPVIGYEIRPTSSEGYIETAQKK